MRINFTPKIREPVEKYNSRDVIKWLKTFLLENGINETHVDKYVEGSLEEIAEINFVDVSNRKYTQAYAAILMLLSTADYSYPSHQNDRRVKVCVSAEGRYSKACKELVFRIKDNLKFHIND